MIRRASILLVVLAALCLRAEEPGAPLENTRQELKALQKGQAQGGDASALVKLRDVMPSAPTPGAEVLPFEMPKAQKTDSDLKKKKDSQKNWLLDGMDKLDKPAKGKTTDRKNEAGAVGEEDKDKPTAGESDSLLAVYSEQKKEAEAKADARQTKPVRSDPMTPFLQGWLADSPVRGKFFDDYIKKPDNAAPGVNPTGPSASVESTAGPMLSGLDLGGGSSHNAPAGPAQARPNPYLQGLDLSALQDSGGASRNQAANPLLQTGVIPPPAPLIDPLPAVRPADKKPLLPMLTDEKKYFPQLNKF